MIFQSYWHIFHLSPCLLTWVIYLPTLCDMNSIVSSHHIHFPKNRDPNGPMSVFLRARAEGDYAISRFAKANGLCE